MYAVLENHRNFLVKQANETYRYYLELVDEVEIYEDQIDQFGEQLAYNSGFYRVHDSQEEVVKAVETFMSVLTVFHKKIAKVTSDPRWNLKVW